MSLPRTLLPLALFLGPLGTGTAAQGARIVVGSKNFTESHVLGEVLTLLLEDRTGYEVVHRHGLGGTQVCFAALESGEIDLYPEYTGTGWAVLLGETEKVDDPLRTYVEVQRRMRTEHDVEWLAPFGLNNTYALAVGTELADELGLRTISDLAEHAPRLRAAFSLEFLNREDGYPGLRAAYGLDFDDVRGMGHALLYSGVEEGSVDVMDAYSTDGKLLEFDLRVLEDDRRYFPPYDAAPVVRGATLRERPELRDVLEELAFRIDDRRMQGLNHAVESGGQSFREVARGLLVEEGLLGEAEQAPGDSPDDGGRWNGLAQHVLEHLRLTFLAVLCASLLGFPLGLWATQQRSVERFALGFAGIVQTVPSLALLAFLIAVPGLGLHTRSAVVALTLYGLLPIVRNTFTGLRGVDPELIEAARAMGLTPGQVLRRVRLPLALPVLMAGVRTATVLSIGFATLAAFIGAGGLGEPILTGLYLNDQGMILSGALPAAVLAIVADALLERLERALTPRGLRRSA